MSDPETFAGLIGEARAGNIELDALGQAFLQLTVAMPSQSDPLVDGVVPVFVNIEGVPYVVVAASSDALGKTSAIAEYAMTLSADHVVTGVAPGLGLLVNTMNDAISFAPEVLADLREKMLVDRAFAED
jgi:hypothetical protein